MLRRLGAGIGAAALLLVASPLSTADPTDVAPAPPSGGAVISAPTLSLVDLGSSEPLSFYGYSSAIDFSIPVPPGLVPSTLNATVALPFPMRSGVLTVSQGDLLISKVGLPLDVLSPIIIPLPGVQVINRSVSLTLALTSVADVGYCLDSLNPVQLRDGSISFTGTEIPPGTVADFLPPILRTLTIGIPGNPSQVESDAAVQLAAGLMSRYRGQNPQVTVVPLADGATRIDAPSAPLERQIVIKEGPDEGVSLIPQDGIPQLLISGPADKLLNQARLMTDPSLAAAVSPRVTAEALHSRPVLAGNTATVGELGQQSLTAFGVSPKVEIGIDQTRFGHSAQGLRVHVVGSHTPAPGEVGAAVTASVGDELLDTWPTNASGVIDHWVNIPDRLLQRYTPLSIGVSTTGKTGGCQEFSPISLTIKPNSVVESSVANPPIPPGFGSLPQALMPRVKVGIGSDAFMDTVRATQIMTGLQRLSAVPLQTEVMPFQTALNSKEPAVLISANGWSDNSIALPVAANERRITVEGPGPGDDKVTLTLDPGVAFGSLQVVFDGQRSLLIATSNGAPAQLDELLKWLATAPGRWQSLSGSAEISVAGRDPASVVGRTPVPAYGPPTSSAQDGVSPGGYRYSSAWWVAAALVGVAAVGAGAIVVSARRRSSGDESAHRRN